MTAVDQGRVGRRRGLGRWGLAGLAALVAAAANAGCGSATSNGASHPKPTKSTAVREPGAGKPPVILGSKNFTEEIILGDLYAQALRARGYAVTLKGDIGDTEVMGRDLNSDRIDGYPEYTGTVLSVLAHDSRPLLSSAQAYRRAAAFERRQGNALLAMAPAQDTDVVITTPAYAAAHHLRSLADLARLGAKATLAGPPEFKTRFSGLVGLRQDYGVTRIRYLPLPIGSQYQALADGRAQLAVAFTTDGNLTHGGYTPLHDPKNIFGFQNVTFIVADDVLAREGKGFAKTIDAVSSILTTQALRLMNAAVTLDQQDPAAVAHQFLAANGLT